MKLYITGSVGSGKSTLAEQISKVTKIPCTHLDEVMFMPCKSASWGNTKRDDEEINEIFYSIIKLDHYIIEDSGRERFIDGMKNADRILVLDFPLKVRKYRIIKRWIKQNLGLEKCIYRPKIDVLKSMFRWIKNYESGKDGVKARISQFKSKVVYLTNQSEVDNFIKTLQEEFIS